MSTSRLALLGLMLALCLGAWGFLSGAILPSPDFFRAWFASPGSEFGVRPMKGDEAIDLYIVEEMSHCENEGGKDGCYEAVAKLLIRRHSLKEVMVEMLSVEQYPAVFNRCHELTHFLAREAYMKNQSVPQTYNQCTEACWGGCYHGVLEQYFLEKGFSLGGVDDAKIAKEMTTVCGKREDYKAAVEFAECFHGLGHAMMFITSQDLPKSLSYCDLLEERSSAEACYGGVFMQNSSNSTNQDLPSPYTDPDDPLFPCTILDEHYLTYCYRYQSSYFSILTHSDWKKISDLCETIPYQYRPECFSTIGSNQVGFTQDFAVMRANCAVVPSQYLSVCIQGAVGSIGIRFRNKPGHAMLDFCDGAPTSTKEACYQHAGQAAFSLLETGDTLERFCGDIVEEHYRKFCLQKTN